MKKAFRETQTLHAGCSIPYWGPGFVSSLEALGRLMGPFRHTPDKARLYARILMDGVGECWTHSCAVLGQVTELST